MIAEITTEGNHPWDVVFPRAKLEGKQHPKGEEL
jgi:hypothetical protein